MAFFNLGSKCHTFLAFMEDGRTGMVDARFVRVSELLAAALVDAFLRHGSERERETCDTKESREREAIVGLF